MEVVVTVGAVSHAKLQSNRHHQQTNIQFVYRPDALPVAQPTVSKHWRETYSLVQQVIRKRNIQGTEMENQNLGCRKTSENGPEDAERQTSLHNLVSCDCDWQQTVCQSMNTQALTRRGLLTVPKITTNSVKMLRFT